MARLNEPPMSQDSFETQRRRMLRQNRDLAKCNNVRALRVRELESELACAISENLELRGRILELEKQSEDSQARRIADHAVAIKEKMESQLTAWGSLLDSLGMEPPRKRHSPQSRISQRPRPSFSATRPSPSQRRLKDIAREVEELGHISEHTAFSRQSLNPEQTTALISDADSMTLDASSAHKNQPALNSDPIKIDSPGRPEPPRTTSSLLNSPIRFPSPINESSITVVASPKKRSTLNIQPDADVASEETTRNLAATSRPIKTSLKRKLGSRDEVDNSSCVRTEEDGGEFKAMAQRISIRDRAHGKTLKELANMRQQPKQRQETLQKPSRQPLSSKTTNEDMGSPRKVMTMVSIDEIAIAKAGIIKQKSTVEKLKPKQRVQKGRPLTVSPLLSLPSPASKEWAHMAESPSESTPSPLDLISLDDTARPSRRNRATISYAEPNLRAKMRRPTKELFGAVDGEGKSRRWSQSMDTAAATRRSDDADASSFESVSPVALPVREAMEKRRRASTRALDFVADLRDEEESGDVDVYEFESSSPKLDESSSESRASRTKASRRFSAAADGNGAVDIKAGSRRRSMMV